MAELRTAPPPPKGTDPYYSTPEHEAWAKAVKDRAGWRCEWIKEDRSRCEASAANKDRMFADHIRELRDGGAAFDVNNGQCLCGTHHTIKTNEEKRRRLGRGLGPGTVPG